MSECRLVVTVTKPGKPRHAPDEVFVEIGGMIPQDGIVTRLAESEHAVFGVWVKLEQPTEQKGE